MANEWGWPFSGGYNGYEEGQQFAGKDEMKRHAHCAQTLQGALLALDDEDG